MDSGDQVLVNEPLAIPDRKFTELLIGGPDSVSRCTCTLTQQNFVATSMAGTICISEPFLLGLTLFSGTYYRHCHTLSGSALQLGQFASDLLCPF
jgi:hypothetical protein